MESDYNPNTGPRALVKFDVPILAGNARYNKDEIAGFNPALAAKLVVPQKLSETLGIGTPAHYVDADGNPSDRPVLVYPAPNRGRW